MRWGEQSTNQSISKRWRRPQATKPPPSPPYQNYVDQSPNRSGRFLDLVDRRRGCTSACGGSGDEFVFGDGECSQAIVQTSHQPDEEVSWHACEKFSALLWNSQHCSDSRQRRVRSFKYSLGTWGKVLNLRLTRLFPGHPLNVLQNTSDYSPQGQQDHTRDHPCCERGGAEVQV